MNAIAKSKMHAAVISTGRQDWGILRGLCHLLNDSDEFDLSLLLGGMHGASQFGSTGKLVVKEGFKLAAELNWINCSNISKPAEQSGAAIQMVSGKLSELKPDFLILVGDRFETAAAALAANLCNVPIVHLHGGEETLGAIDNNLRHAITKLSHLHLTSHVDHAQRVLAMGESENTVHVVGAPGLDNLHRSDLPSKYDLEKRLEMSLDSPVVVVTVHPTTVLKDSLSEVREIVEAMSQVPAVYVITLPNVDPSAQEVRELLIEVGQWQRCVAVEALGEAFYWTLLKEADAMLGNSSSALIEAPAVQLPAVNVGMRQKERLCGPNVIHVDSSSDMIKKGLELALSSDFRRSLLGKASIFGNGDASPKIFKILKEWIPPVPPIKDPIII